MNQLGVIAGLRLVTFRTVRGFRSLAGSEDFATGIVATTSLGRTFGDAGNMLAAELYLGAGGERWFATLDGSWERQRVDGDTRDAVAAGRIVGYWKPIEERTYVLSVDFAGAWSPSVPYQLALGRDDGIRAYDGAGLVGARRLIARGEARWLLGDVGEALGYGVGAFSELGMVWDGGVPFGQTTAPRPAVGVSLLLAVPRDSRRLVRADLAVPLVPDEGAGFVFRVSSDLPGIWRPPRPISRLRPVSPRGTIFDLR